MVTKLRARITSRDGKVSGRVRAKITTPARTKGRKMVNYLKDKEHAMKARARSMVQNAKARRR